MTDKRKRQQQPKRQRDGSYLFPPAQAKPPRWQNPWDRRPPGTKAKDANERSRDRARGIGRLLPKALRPGASLAAGLRRILGE